MARVGIACSDPAILRKPANLAATMQIIDDVVEEGGQTRDGQPGGPAAGSTAGRDRTARVSLPPHPKKERPRVYPRPLADYYRLLKDLPHVRRVDVPGCAVRDANMIPVTIPVQYAHRRAGRNQPDHRALDPGSRVDAHPGGEDVAAG